MTIARRNQLLIVLGVIAFVILIVALFVRPAPLPPGSASFVQSPVQGNPSALAVPGRTYAVDALSANGVSAPPATPLAIPARGTLHVAGWAVDPRTLGPIDHLIVRIDARPATIIANCHESRPDVAAVLGVPSAAASGFDGDVSTKGLAAGRHAVTFTAVAQDHRIFPLPTTGSIIIAKG